MNPLQERNAVRFETGPKPTWSIIGLHGLGADGHDLEPVVHAIAPRGVAVRFVLPHAPIRSVAINGGETMPAWFDVYGLDRNAKIDQDGLKEAHQTVHAFIRAEHDQGINYENIVLFGFSQGGALALHTALSHKEQLGGVVGLSTYLLNAKSLEATNDVDPKNLRTPIFMAHGRLDPVVDFEVGRASMQLLKSKGFETTWKTYSMPHAICEEELVDLANWLQNLIKGESTE